MAPAPNVSFYITNVKTGAALTASGTTVFSSAFNLNSPTQQWQLHYVSSSGLVIQSVGTGYYLVINGDPGTSALKLSTTPSYWNILPATASPNNFLIQKPNTSIVVTQIAPSAVDIQYLSSPSSGYQGWAFTDVGH